MPEIADARPEHGSGPGAASPSAPTLTLGLRTFDPSPIAHWDPLLAWARAADEAGIDRLVLSDHVVLGERLGVHHESGGGRFPTGSDGAWLEPMTLMSYLAAMTSNVRLATAILIVPLRRPVVLAKALATLDVLSGGRIELGVGVGWQREEYEAAGLDFAARGELLDDALAVLRTLWSESPATYSSDRLHFESIWCEPKPLQAGGVPIWVSGTLSRPVVERILRFGTGWIPWAEHRADVVGGVAAFRRAVADAGRDPAGFQIRHDLPVVTAPSGVVDVDATVAPVQELVDIGVTDFRLLLPPPEDRDDGPAVLQALVKVFRDAVGR